MRAARAKVGKLHRVHRFERGSSFTIGDATIHAIPTPHDAADGSCFIVEHNGKRLGIFTDLGHPFAALADALASVDAAYLESNYDDDMIAGGHATARANLSFRQRAVSPALPRLAATGHLRAIP